MSIATAAENLVPLIGGHLPVPDADQCHSQWTTCEKEDLVEDIDRRDHKQNQEPYVEKGVDLLVEYVQWEQAQGIYVLDTARGAHGEELAAGDAGKDSGALHQPAVVVEAHEDRHSGPEFPPEAAQKHIQNENISHHDQQVQQFGNKVSNCIDIMADVVMPVQEEIGHRCHSLVVFPHKEFLTYS